jgi:hypothetical protein
VKSHQYRFVVACRIDLVLFGEIFGFHTDFLLGQVYVRSFDRIYTIVSTSR